MRKRISSEKIRTRLRKYAQLFIDNNCHYSYNEHSAVEEVLHQVGAVNPAYEALNKEHPDHGQKITK